MRHALNALTFAVMTLSLTLPLAGQARADHVVFADDFDGGRTVAPDLTASYSGVVSIESVQGYAGIGAPGNQFAGSFLRNSSGGTRTSPGSVPTSPTALTLAGLPAHTSIDLSSLLAVISSWDGSSGEGGAGGDFFNVKVDGTLVFSESFDKFFASDQSYVPPPGGLLTPRPFPDLGFPDPDVPGAVFPDAAYDMGLEPRFRDIPHTTPTLTVEWFADGPGWQGGNDESWAIENLEVTLNGVQAVPEPSSLGLAGAGVLLLLGTCWRRAVTGRTREVGGLTRSGDS